MQGSCKTVGSESKFRFTPELSRVVLIAEQFDGLEQLLIVPILYIIYFFLFARTFPVR